MRCLLATAILTALSIGPAAAADDLAGTAWSVDQGKSPHIRFKAGGKVSGNASCNSFFGSYSTSGTSITFKGFGTTKKLCPPPKMRAERAFLASLKAATEFRIESRALQLIGANGSVVINLKRSRPK